MAQNVTDNKTAETLLPIGQRIKAARAAAGLTIAEVSLELGVDQRTVAGWQSGRSRPSYERLVQFAALVGQPASYFLDPEPDEEEAA